MKSFLRRTVLVLVAIALVGAIVMGLMPAPVEVDLAEASVGSIRVTVDQDGKTRIRERYVVSAPLAGRLLRIEMEPGDEVHAGETLLAAIEPRDPDLLDARAIAQAEARVKASEAAFERSGTAVREATANQADAERDLQRVREMARTKAATQSEVEDAELLLRIRGEEVRSARLAEEIARFELDQARAALIRSRPSDDPPAGTNGGDAGGWNITITSPVDGRVFRVFQKSSAVVGAGTPLLELGDPSDLEVEIDVLSRDAVKIPPGAPVLLEQWGGEEELHGRVELVEPSAFTKISTLGVEEQRGERHRAPVGPPPRNAPPWATASGSRPGSSSPKPATCCSCPPARCSAWGTTGPCSSSDVGVARQRIVKLGLQNGLKAEVVEGLTEGDVVVVHPGDAVQPGVRLRQR